MKTIIATLATIMAFSLNANALQLETGKYLKTGMQTISDYNLNVSPNSSRLIEIQNNNMKISINDREALRALPLEVDFNKLNTRQTLSANLTKKLKSLYKGNAFVDKVTNAFVVVTDNNSKEIKLNMNFDLTVHSKFATVQNIRLTSDVKLENGQCQFYTWNSDNNKANYSPLECIKMTSFTNTRVTDMKTDYTNAATNNLIGFVADVVIQIIYSPIEIVDYLIPMNR